MKGFADYKFNVAQNIKFVVQSRKHFGKRRICRLPALSHFLALFLKGLYLRGWCQKSHLCGKWSKDLTRDFETSAVGLLFNPLPDNNILNWSKLKAFTDDKINVLKIIIILLSLIGLKTLWEKRENAGCQHFLLLPQCFQRALY